MIYLSGHVGKDLIGVRPDLGFMLTPMSNYTMPDIGWWGADTGCFAAPDKFRVTDYIVWLHRHRKHADRCLFATAPDVVGNAVATWGRSQPILPLIRELGFPAALVAQDGWDSGAVDWDAFDVLFIGGTTTFKLSERAYQLIKEAKGRAKWVHVGRVNSLRRIKAMAVAGADSSDGNKLSFGPDTHREAVLGWLETVNGQHRLWEVA